MVGNNNRFFSGWFVCARRLVLRKRRKHLLYVGVGYQQHRLGDRSRLRVHHKRCTCNHDHYFNDYNFIFNNHFNNHNRTRHDNFDIYNNPSSRKFHNDFNSSVNNNHANDNNKHDHDHNWCTSSDNNASTLHSSSDHDD